MLIFVWIPKTSGTSIQKTLNLKTYIENYYEFDNRGDVTFAHLSVRELLAGGFISKEYWNNSYPFSVVRNPYSRFVSLWFDFKKSKRITPDISLQEFAHICKHYTRKPGLYNVMDFSQAASQVSWLVHGVNIMRFEELPETFPKIFGKPLLHENKATEGDWRDYYDPHTARMVTELYRDDLAILNYDIHK